MKKIPTVQEIIEAAVGRGWVIPEWGAVQIQEKLKKEARRHLPVARIAPTATVTRDPCDCTPETCCCRQKNVDKAEAKK